MTDLETGIVSAASGSAYYELRGQNSNTASLVPTSSTVKLSCAVHGPKPLPRNANFSPNLQLNATVKYAPFATRTRRGYIRDATERDLSIHLENALKGLILPDRWPKSSVDVSILVLEGEDNEDMVLGQTMGAVAGQVGLMNLLAGCITVATAALLDAQIDCLDVMAGGVAATVKEGSSEIKILDPSPAEHEQLLSACVVGYLDGRDEVTEVWTTGAVSESGSGGAGRFDELMDSAVGAAKAASVVLKEVVKESTSRRLQALSSKGKAKTMTNNSSEDVEMKT